MRVHLLAPLLLGLLLSGPAGAKDKHWNTYPMPPKLKPDDPMRVFPGYEIPEHPERYVWKVTGKLRGKLVYPQGVPAYGFDFNGIGRPARRGIVPLDTEIKLDVVHLVGHVHFYGIAFPDEKTLSFVSGLFIEPAAYTPPVQ